MLHNWAERYVAQERVALRAHIKPWKYEACESPLSAPGCCSAFWSPCHDRFCEGFMPLFWNAGIFVTTRKAVSANDYRILQGFQNSKFVAEGRGRNLSGPSTVVSHAVCDSDSPCDE